MSSTSQHLDPKRLNNHFILGEIVDHVQDLVKDHPQVDFTELRGQLVNVQNQKYAPEEQMRGFLRAFKHTTAFKDAISKLDGPSQSQIAMFMQGKTGDEVMKTKTSPAPATATAPTPAVKQHSKMHNFFHSMGHHKKKTGVLKKDAVSAAKARDLPVIYENSEHTKIMDVYPARAFNNWGLNVKNTPRLTFVPTTVYGLQNVVLFAKKANLRVRCSGYRHSWSPIFSGDGQILVSLIKVRQATHIPDASSIDPDPASVKENELKSIDLDPPGVKAAAGKRLVRVGAAVTSDEFRRWAVANKSWTMPVDVILVEVTCGGVNAAICHGAGRSHRTISDIVRAIEYVDVNGVHQKVTDPAYLKAAAGCFGLLGIVTHITLELDPMSYAIMAPRKPDIGLAIPPLKMSDIPHALRKDWTDQDFSRAVADFEHRAQNDYYSEWFWFTYQSTAWVNTWKNVAVKPDDVADYPSAFDVWIQWMQGWLAAIISSTSFFQAIPGYWQAQILATFSMAFLPPTVLENKQPEIKTYLPDALHFRRGIQNFRVRDLEFQIPIPSLPNDKSLPDYTIVRRAWWDVINLVYNPSGHHSAHLSLDPSTPMRLTLELRIMSDSSMLMASQRGNIHGTACIEVLTIPDSVDDGEWQGFCQRVCDMWMGYVDGKGAKLNVRPHWAKEWAGLSMGGVNGQERMPAEDYLKKIAYKEAIPEFKNTLANIGLDQGWTLQDLQQRFSNEFFDRLIYS